ncbi:hypothetical protein I79_008272 [Cricetulus griseus]|uniref:Uncharacterized protein n=1 Tax=Cricetulus griseus TaxID=10029 RepID=G3HCQ8_CRIGR|nr:hypothetical protein I79_008272 [Cricetulus griseus]
MRAGGSLQAARSYVCTGWHMSALRSRVKSFNMTFRRFFLSVSWRKVKHHPTDEHFKDACFSCHNSYL